MTSRTVMFHDVNICLDLKRYVNRETRKNNVTMKNTVKAVFVEDSQSQVTAVDVVSIKQNGGMQIFLLRSKSKCWGHKN